MSPDPALRKKSKGLSRVRTLSGTEDLNFHDSLSGLPAPKEAARDFCFLAGYPDSRSPQRVE